MKMFWRVVRTVHLYLSLLGLVLVLFFAVSGFMLNHEGWFKTQEIRDTEMSVGSIPRGMIPAEAAFESELEPAAQAKIEQHLRSEFKIRGVLRSAVVQTEEKRIELAFESPGRTQTAIIFFADTEDEPTANARVALHSESTGFVGRLTEMHKSITKTSGEDGPLFVGKQWRLIVDCAAVVLVLTSLTGLLLWLAALKRQWLAAVALIAGAAIFVVAYLVLVP